MVVIEEIEKWMTKRGQTLSCAESCTGGGLSARLVAHPGVSSFYLGAVVAYANSLKENILQVPAELIRTEGAVSRSVALAMALGAQRVSQSTWAISTTGIAGPTGGTKEKPVGTVCFGLVGPGIEVSTQKLFSGDRHQIQEQSVKYAIELLIQNLKGE
jgi:nicotinamide-nucleotide amidase